MITIKYNNSSEFNGAINELLNAFPFSIGKRDHLVYSSTDLEDTMNELVTRAVNFESTTIRTMPDRESRNTIAIAIQINTIAFKVKND